MNAKQVEALRDQINAAHKTGNVVQADQLQDVLHAHFVAEAEAFMVSPAGAVWQERIALAE